MSTFGGGEYDAVIRATMDMTAAKAAYDAFIAEVEGRTVKQVIPQFAQRGAGGNGANFAGGQGPPQLMDMGGRAVAMGGGFGGMRSGAAGVAGAVHQAQASAVAAVEVAAVQAAQGAAQRVQGQAAGAARGAGSFFAVGQGVTAMALVHAGSQIYRGEETYRTALADAGGSHYESARAEIERRTGYDELLLGLGRVGRHIREMGPDETTTEQVQGILRDAKRQEERIAVQREGMKFSRGMERQAYGAEGVGSYEQRQRGIEGAARGRGESIQEQFTKQRDSASAHYQQEMEKVRAERERLSGFRVTGGPWIARVGYGPTDQETADLDAREQMVRRDRDSNASKLTASEQAAKGASGHIQSAESLALARDTYVQRQGILSETDDYRQTAMGGRGRQAEYASLRRTVGQRNLKAFEDNDPNLDAIREQGGQQLAAAKYRHSIEAATMGYRLSGEAQVSTLRAQNRNFEARVTDTFRAGVLRYAAADPQDREAVGRANLAQLGEVAAGGMRDLQEQNAANYGAAAVMNKLRAHDPLGARLEGIEQQRQRELRQAGGIMGFLSRPGINARYGALAGGAKQFDAERRESIGFEQASQLEYLKKVGQPGGDYHNNLMQAEAMRTARETQAQARDLRRAGFGDLVPGVYEVGKAAIQAQRRAVLDQFEPARVDDINKVAFSDPSDTLKGIAESLKALENVPSKDDLQRIIDAAILKLDQTN